jgi:Family of unknown function (DUF5871)
MSSSNIVYSSNFNVKNVTVSAPRLLQSGARQAFLGYAGERLVMQTAVAMSVPFGLNCADKFGPPQYSVDLSFRGFEQRPEVKEFMDAIQQLDDALLQEGVKNSKAWFKSNQSLEVMKAFYTPSLKYSKDKDGNVLSYPPTIKLKLRKVNDQFETKFYDLNRNPYKNVPVEELLVKGVQVTAIIECAGVWFAGSKFGLTWRAVQIAIHKLPEKMGDFAFKGLGAPALRHQVEDVEDEEDVPAQEVPVESDHKSSNEVDDDSAFRAPPSVPSVVTAMMPAPSESSSSSSSSSSVDDDAGDDLEPVPVPRKTVVKKKVITAPKK